MSSGRPTPEEILAELREGSQGRLSDKQLKSAALDVLHFVWSVHKSGGHLLYSSPQAPHPAPVDIKVPGLFGDD